MIDDDCLLVFVLWCVKPHVVMHMCVLLTKQGLLVIALYTVEVPPPSAAHKLLVAMRHNAL